MPELLIRARRWLAPAAAVLAAIFALPPVGSYARQFASVQAFQFVIFAVIAPALLVLGMAGSASPGAGTAARLRTAAARLIPGRPGARALVSLLPFIVLVIFWRLPGVLAALSRDPVLTAAELVTLAAAGSALWLELLGSLDGREPLAIPLRATMTTVAMWTIWIIGYITGMSHLPALPARGPAATVLSAATDWQMAAGILWAVPAICFLPVIYFMVTSWLGGRVEAEHELGAPVPVMGSYPKPPRGWRSGS